MLNSNIGPNIAELPIEFEGMKLTLINYTTFPKNRDIDQWNVFNLCDLKGIQFGMDFQMALMGINDSDPKEVANAHSAISVFFEAAFPKQGKAFYTAACKVKLRNVVINKRTFDLPTVLFFVGRRVIIQPASMGYATYSFSPVNDKADIWKELYASDNYAYYKITKAQFQKYMPELKYYK